MAEKGQPEALEICAFFSFCDSGFAVRFKDSVNGCHVRPKFVFINLAANHSACDQFILCFSSGTARTAHLFTPLPKMRPKLRATLFSAAWPCRRSLGNGCSPEMAHTAPVTQPTSRLGRLGMPAAPPRTRNTSDCRSRRLGSVSPHRKRDMLTSDSRRASHARTDTSQVRLGQA